MLSEDQIWDVLQTVKDPEIPTISVVELGIVRSVQTGEDGVHVQITPTFAGCPALNVMAADIKRALAAKGVESVEVETVLAPAWSSDWISAEGKQKLKQHGLAPPRQHGGNIVMTFFDVVECPRCDSKNTTLQNSFGSTLCRAIWTCNDCQETFEQFKPI